jgi:hypothetical protein
MVKKSKLLSLTLILLLGFSLNAFGQYADLVGKWVRLNGPQERGYIGLAYNEEACDKLIVAQYCRDEMYFDNLLRSFDVLVIKNYTSAVLLDTEIFKGKAKVALLSGPNVGITGWIPIEWLDNNEARPRLGEQDEWMVGEFKAPGIDHLWQGYIRKDKML